MSSCCNVISMLDRALDDGYSCLLHVIYGAQLGIYEKIDVPQQIIEQFSPPLVEVLAIFLPPGRDLGRCMSDISNGSVLLAAGSCSIGGGWLIVHSSM